MPLQFLPAVPADGRFAADVLTARTPDDPRDPIRMEQWWAQRDPGWTELRRVVLAAGERVGFLSVWWPEWKPGVERFAGCGAAVLPGRDELLSEVVAELERLAREAGAERLQCDCPELDAPLLEAFAARGWERGRQSFRSEIDLAGGGGRLRELWAAAATRLEAQGIELTTLVDRDEEFLRRLLDAANRAWEDIPRTQPFTPLELDGLLAWLDSPSSSRDSWFVAMHGGEPIGLSVISYPAVRGFPHTETTAVHPEWRGRGVALGLKLATLMQAIERGHDRARTENDTTNAPILHLNREVLGYRLVPGEQEMLLKL